MPPPPSRYGVGRTLHRGRELTSGWQQRRREGSHEYKAAPLQANDEQPVHVVALLEQPPRDEEADQVKPGLGNVREQHIAVSPARLVERVVVRCGVTISSIGVMADHAKCRPSEGVMFLATLLIPMRWASPTSVTTARHVRRCPPLHH